MGQLGETREVDYAEITGVVNSSEPSRIVRRFPRDAGASAARQQWCTEYVYCRLSAPGYRPPVRRRSSPCALAHSAARPGTGPSATRRTPVDLGPSRDARHCAEIQGPARNTDSVRRTRSAEPRRAHRGVLGIPLSRASTICARQSRRSLIRIGRTIRRGMSLEVRESRQPGPLRLPLSRGMYRAHRRVSEALGRSYAAATGWSRGSTMTGSSDAGLA